MSLKLFLLMSVCSILAACGGGGSGSSGGTPTPAPTSVPTDVPTSEPTATSSPTAQPTAEPTPTATPAIDPIPGVTLTPTPSPTATTEPTIDPTATPTAAPEPTATPSPAVTPMATPTATPSPAVTPTATPTATPIPAVTPTATPTATPSPTVTPTATPTASPTVTPTPIATPNLVAPTPLSFIQGELVDIEIQNTGAGDLDVCDALGLPAGINISVSDNGQTCQITGEANSVFPAEDIEISATNSGGVSDISFSLEVVGASPFITTWRTDASGNATISEENQITIQTNPAFIYNFNIDWGDGSSDAGVTDDITHTYETAGEYTVTITGVFPQLYSKLETPLRDADLVDVLFGALDIASDASKLLSVEQWGNRPWSSMELFFAGASNLVINDSLSPNLSRVTSLAGMFYYASDYNSPVDHWDVSAITDMSFLFTGATLFNQPLVSWDVSNVQDMQGMFAAMSVFNQDIGQWDVSKVTDISAMFGLSESFNQDLNTWDVSNVTNMFATFASAESFNGEVSTWDVSMVSDMQFMFNRATAFNQDISAWDVSNVTDMSAMFLTAVEFDQDISAWDVSSVTDMASMLQDANLSIENYNALLIGWASQPLQNNIFFSVGDTPFSGDDAIAAKQVLESTFNWRITDGGEITAPSFNVLPDDIIFYINHPESVVFNSTSGFIESCTIDPVIEGLTVAPSANASSCEISGAATELLASREVTLTAVNALGVGTGTFNLAVIPETPYITEWQTDNPGASDDNQITIKVSDAFGYNYRVDWGDGNIDENVTDEITHTYTEAGLKTVSITGVYPQSFFEDTTAETETDSLKLVRVVQWGDRPWRSMTQAFTNCDNLEITDTANPDLSRVSSMRRAFKHADNFNSDISNWDVSTITNMSELFNNARLFNQDIGSWDVSSVTNMSSMFNNAREFDQPIGNWNVSSVVTMRSMFSNARSFNQAIGDWDVSSVRDMVLMFDAAELFNQQIGDWDVSSVTRMSFMFRNAEVFNQPIGDWQVSNLRDARSMFQGARAFNGDIGGWDTSSVELMSSMFLGAHSFNQNINSWNVSSVTTMRSMFNSALAFDQPLDQWDVSNVRDMREMFINANSFDQDLGDWDVSSVTNMFNMLINAPLSTENYNLLLIGWSELPLQSDVTFDAGSVQFSGDEATAARDVLENIFNWTVSDGGLLLQ